MLLKYLDLQMFGLKLNKYEYFHSLEVVGRVARRNFMWVKI